MFAKFEDGHVHYQDEFGRTEKQRDFLKKDPPTRPLRTGDLCGCGSGLSFKACCEPKPIALRRTWNERSIRERNLMLQNGIVNVLGLKQEKDWVRVRRDLTDEQISKIYLLYEGLWPRETDLLQLLPKPDGIARAVYTGSIHPTAITEFALGASVYFGELIIQHPFLHAGTVKKEFSPVDNPRAYTSERDRRRLTLPLDAARNNQARRRALARRSKPETARASRRRPSRRSRNPGRARRREAVGKLDAAAQRPGRRRSSADESTERPRRRSNMVGRTQKRHRRFRQILGRHRRGRHPLLREPTHDNAMQGTEHRNLRRLADRAFCRRSFTALASCTVGRFNVYYHYAKSSLEYRDVSGCHPRAFRKSERYTGI